MASVEIPTIEAVGEYEPHQHARYSGYRPTIKWDGVTIWAAGETVPFHHGDYDETQRRNAEMIAHQHIVSTLSALFKETP